MKSTVKTNWTKQEFQTYLFIFCMNADYKETKEELKTISIKSNEAVYEKMHSEFEKDNDYVSIQKLQASINELNYTEEEIKALFDEIKELFLSDGKYEILERNLMTGLKRLFN